MLRGSAERNWHRTSPYGLKYAYYAGGNRTQQWDFGRQELTEYHYDVESPGAYGSANNRLMYSETSGLISGNPGGPLLSTTWYTYTGAGNVERVITKKEEDCASQQENLAGGGGGEESMTSSGSDSLTSGGGGEAMGFGGGGGCVGGNCPVNSCKYTAIRFAYAKNAQAVTHVVGEALCGDASPLRGRGSFLSRLRRCWDGQSQCGAGGGPTCYKVNWAREFRYDESRARYMDRRLSTTGLSPIATLTAWNGRDWDRADYKLRKRAFSRLAEGGVQGVFACFVTIGGSTS